MDSKDAFIIVDNPEPSAPTSPSSTASTLLLTNEAMVQAQPIPELAKRQHVKSLREQIRLMQCLGLIIIAVLLLLILFVAFHSDNHTKELRGHRSDFAEQLSSIQKAITVVGEDAKAAYGQYEERLNASLLHLLRRTKQTNKSAKADSLFTDYEYEDDSEHGATEQDRWKQRINVAKKVVAIEKDLKKLAFDVKLTNFLVCVSLLTFSIVAWTRYARKS